MSLVPSLLQAIVRVDGEALVMHVGEKPYVVSPNGQVDLATRGLTFEAVNGIVTQLLPAHALKSLEDVGATQFELPAFDEFPGEHFTVTAARGGDDVWAEIRRRQVSDDDLLPADIFTSLPEARAAEASAPESDDLALPQEDQLWPARTQAADADALEPLLDEPPAPVFPPPAPATEVSAPELAAPEASSAPAFASIAAIDAPDQRGAEPVTFAPMAAADVPAEPVASDVSAAFAVPEPPAAAVIEFAALAGSAPFEPAPVTLAPSAPEPVAVQPMEIAEVADVVAVSPVPDSADVAAVVEVPVVAEVPVVEVPVVEVPAVVVAAENEDATPIVAPAATASGSIEIPAIPEPLAAEPALVEAVTSEPAPVPATLAATSSPEAHAVEPVSEVVMSTTPPDFQSFASFTPSVLAPSAPAPASFAAASGQPATAAAGDGPSASAFVPFPSLSDQPQPAVVLPIGRGMNRETNGSPSEAGSQALERLLRLAASRGASALYLSSNQRPSVRLDGDIQPLEGSNSTTAQEIESLLAGAMPEATGDAMRAGLASEWVWDLSEVGRVRCASFRDHRGPGAVFRLVPAKPLSASHLGLSREIQALTGETEGLILVSGPRANGKSTLMSSFVDLINRTRRDYVITIEHEINVVHERQGAFISQREVRGGSDDVLAAARAALREDPDVLVLEDIRTAALMSVALDAAAAGQLVIGAVPAHHATGAIDRLIEMYQPEYRRQAQLSLAQNLRGVVTQVLLRKSGGGRVAAREVLLNTPIVSSLLAEGRTAQLPVAIEGGRKSGMVPLNDALVGFVQSGAVDVREAYRRASDRSGLLDLLKRQGIDTSFVERLA